MVPFLLAAILFSYFGLQRRRWQQGGDLKPSSYKDITTYNNVYEFGTDNKDAYSEYQRTNRKTPGTHRVQRRTIGADP